MPASIFRRILVPHDFSPQATVALKTAANLAREHDGTLTVLHAIVPFYVPADVPFDEAEVENPEDDADRQLFRRALALIQADFSERTWQAFWRVVVDGRSPADVGDELAMRPGAVRVAKSRVLHRLRQELGDLLE